MIMVRENYRMPAYLSDLGGNDPRAHGNNRLEIVRIVLRYLHRRPGGAPLPGHANIYARMIEFEAGLPEMAAAMKKTEDDLDAFREYRSHLGHLEE